MNNLTYLIDVPEQKAAALSELLHNSGVTLDLRENMAALGPQADALKTPSSRETISPTPCG